VQGGLDLGLRDASIRDLQEGLSWVCHKGWLVERKERFLESCRILHVEVAGDEASLRNGYGYPVDLVVCSALGADMFDSVYPTRTARLGIGLTSKGVVKIKRALSVLPIKGH